MFDIRAYTKLVFVYVHIRTVTITDVLEVPNKHWLSAVEGTVLASVNAFHFLHRVRFGGLPVGASLGSGLDQVDFGEDTSDLDASRMIRRCCKRRSPRSQDGGTISQDRKAHV